MQSKIKIEGVDEFGTAHCAEMEIKKDFDRLSSGEIGFSVADGKVIMPHLQAVVVQQQCETYVWTKRLCADCETFRGIKDYSKRKIRTVFGRVEVKNPRILSCQRCLPAFCSASVVRRDICPDQATPELMELSARLGSLLPHRKAADVMAEFLPVSPSAEVEARTFEIAVARCGRGGRGSRPGHYFVTADTSKRDMRSRTLQALQHEGYAGRGEVTVLSDGAEILKRRQRSLPQPTTHIIDWFHIAMKIQPLQQVAYHIVRWRQERTGETAALDEQIRALKWKLWHGQVNRAIQHLERMIAGMTRLCGQGDLSARRVWNLAHPLLTYIRSNRHSIVGYGARHRSGRRIATALAEPTVNSLIARRMVKKQQMQWSRRGAHLMLQVRATVPNGDLRQRLACEPPRPQHRSRFAWIMEPTPPLLKIA